MPARLDVCSTTDCNTAVSVLSCLVGYDDASTGNVD